MSVCSHGIESANKIELKDFKTELPQLQRIQRCYKYYWQYIKKC